MHLTTKALVLREVNYKESDKILTLLTAEEGKLTVSARGCRKKGSALAAAGQLLVWSEMTLYEYQGRWAVKEAVTDLLDNRDGLMCGICNGFQALIKLGLVPYGKIIDTDENCPTLTFNNINRHQSRIVHTRIASTKSPWLSLMNVGDVVNVPISHGEGKFLCSPELALQLAENGQIATQYVDLEGNPTNGINFNPNGSLFAIEGITSPDGRVFGKMGHSERIADGLYRNVPGEYDIRMFEAAVKYFKG